ncbi:MAG TPA: hypothetical protein PKM63_12280 [Panacibacter sp.]|nr:hypothetical protein [Panacibacter sp.]HNP45057.1 hypothetical protein [Panacibacter sp.]
MIKMLTLFTGFQLRRFRKNDEVITQQTYFCQQQKSIGEKSGFWKYPEKGI